MADAKTAKHMLYITDSHLTPQVKENFQLLLWDHGEPSVEPCDI
jgi:hypothetical protein